MNRTEVVVIGAGQAGLAMSRCLTEVGADHVVLERGRTAERWHSERWDSLRLLTPNWASRLPGWQYRGPHPDGYMTAGELAAYLTDYAASFAAPIEHDSEVQAVRRGEHGFVVRAGDVTWTAPHVVLATGWCDRPRVPAMSAGLHPSIRQCTPSTYRRPADLPADGQHSRAPRRYRGMDIWWWLDRIGTFSTTIDSVSDPARSRAEGAIQLVGRDDHRDVDLAALHALGVRLTGRLTAIDGVRATFADDLVTTTADADERLRRLLGQIDAHIDEHGLRREVLAADVPAPVPAVAPLPSIDLRAAGITTVLWATGYRRHHPWLHVPVLDRSGEVAQRRGVTPVDGLYVLGQRFQHRRDSNFIDGVRHDAVALTRHLVDRFSQPATH